MAGLTEMERRILGVLRQTRKTHITQDQLLNLAGWYFPGGHPMTANCLHVHIRNMRKKGIQIETVTTYRVVM